uniref:Gamma-tubulin complex component 2 n=1 Tax=Strigamia maritima TaxID=126957 RepID=T1JH36_STRMM
MGLCLDKEINREDFPDFSALSLLVEPPVWLDAIRQGKSSEENLFQEFEMSEFKVHHDVSELIKLLSGGTEGITANLYTDLLLKNKLPYLTTQMSSYNAVRRLAEMSASQQDFLDLYEELKSKNIKHLNSLIYLLSKIAEDPTTKAFLESTPAQRQPSQETTNVSPGPGTKMSAEELSQIKDLLLKATTDNSNISHNERNKEIIQKKTSNQVPILPSWYYDRPYLSLDFVDAGRHEDIVSDGVGPLGTLPLATQEHILLEELLYCLSGIEGDYIHAQPMADKMNGYSFSLDESIDSSLKEMVRRVLPICANYSAVIRFIEKRSSFEYGMVNHALTAAMRTLMKDYLLLVAQLEHQLRQGLLTMQKLWYYLQPTKRTIEILTSIAIAITKANSRGGTVLTLLHDKTNSLNGDAKAQELCLFLIQNACVPYFEILEKWIYKGVISDLYGEFLVEDNEIIQKEELPIDYISDTYWEKRYTICRERIPSFLENIADMILRTGKYLNVIRQCGKVIQCPYAEEIVFTKKECQYVECIEKAYEFASKKLLDLLIEESDLMGRLRSVKHYFLLDQGDFIVQFMDMAEDELKKNINDIMPTRLESLLELALRTSVASNDPYNDDVRVELLPYDLMTQMFKILSIETKEEKDYKSVGELKLSGLEAFSFDYEVKWPLSLILNRKALACYQMLFRHLFYSKHVERLLCNVWISNKVAKKFPLCDARSYGAAFALRQRMLNYVQNLEYYMMFEVLEPNWNVFLAKMLTVTNVDDVLLYHTQFLTFCLQDCMLTSPELLRLVSRLMTICITFSNFIQRMNRYFVEAEMVGILQQSISEYTDDDSSPDSEAQPVTANESFEQRIARFDLEFTELLVTLLDRISDLGRDNYNDKLVNIIYRLDFNGFYTQHLEALAMERSRIIDPHHPIDTQSTNFTPTLRNNTSTSCINTFKLRGAACWMELMKVLGVMKTEMADEQVTQLELLCKQLYESTDASQRTEAEKTLVNFANNPDCLSKCQLLLERGDSAYAQLLAATTLSKLMARNSNSLTLQQRVDIRNYILNYLVTRPKLANFVIQALVQLFSRLTKLGWFDSDKDEYFFRNVITHVTRFLQGSVEHCMIGVQLLSQLTCEMNQVSETEANRSLTKHRKVASSFRDTQLYEIFQISCTLLRTALENCKNLNFNDEGQHGLMTQLLRLAHNCLTFDFIGTSTDESSDDLCTVQIPTNWRPAFLDFNTLQLFFDLYASLPSSLSPLALSCLVQIASVRRSLFTNAERAKFLAQLVNGVKAVLENPQGLSDTNNYHEFCRLLARLKSNYQLGELVKVETYPETIALIAKFTITSLQMWQFAPNSVHYLLSLWQRMVASVPYVKASEPHLLENFTPGVTNSYVTSRLESVTAILTRDGHEDPLDDLGMVSQQLDQLSTIGRCEYEKTCSLLVQLFDQSAQSYQEILNNRNSSAPQLEIPMQEGRLTWLVYIIGAAVGGRVSFNSNDEHDAMDGELVCRVLQLMNLTDSRLTHGGCERLELAMLSFFEQFRKIYVGEQVQKTSRVYRRLSEVLGLSDESMVLSVFIRKIITNLKYWGSSEQIISKTLQLLNDLSVGYSSVRKLVKLDEVQFMLNNHTSEHFPFLGNTAQIGDMRCRTTFYTSLGRLLMVDLGEDEEKFEQFMLPVTGNHCTSLDAIGNLLANADTPLFRAEEAKKALVGLARDLRGIAFAFNTKTSYMMLFDWIYPTYTPILQRAIELWYHDPVITTPVLKLMAELVQNRSQRLQFDVSSPNGILLFRETSKIIVSYGTRILTLGDIPKEQLYPMKLKGISICFSMLKAALCGSYVNFGVFRLYGDDALDNALQTFVKLLLSIPQTDLLDYPKLSQTYYVLLECLAQDHMSFISNLEPSVFLYILSSISEGLTALDTMVCTGCCATLDHIVTYLFKRLSIKGKKIRQNQTQDNETFLQILELHPEILQQVYTEFVCVSERHQ